MYKSGNLSVLVSTITAIMRLKKCHLHSTKWGIEVQQQGCEGDVICKTANSKTTNYIPQLLAGQSRHPFQFTLFTLAFNNYVIYCNYSCHYFCYSLFLLQFFYYYFFYVRTTRQSLPCALQTTVFLIDNVQPKHFQHSFWCIDNVRDAN
jgi:hypothetical protein